MAFGQKKQVKDAMAMEIKPNPTKRTNFDEIIGVGLSPGVPVVEQPVAAPQPQQPQKKEPRCMCKDCMEARGEK